MNVQHYGVQELNARELQTIDGGRLGGLRKLWKLAKKYGGKLLAAAGVYDAIDEFSAGFSEGNC